MPWTTSSGTRFSPCRRHAGQPYRRLPQFQPGVPRVYRRPVPVPFERTIGAQPPALPTEGGVWAGLFRTDPGAVVKAFLFALLLPCPVACGGPELQLWHATELGEEYSGSKANEATSFADYLALEYRLFAEMQEAVYHPHGYQTGADPEPRQRL